MSEQEKNKGQTEEVCEFADMLNGLSEYDKAQVKGIIIGIRMTNREGTAGAAGRRDGE